MAPAVRPGAVEWTGDNPFVYLKREPDGDWSSLSLFFRITASDAGVGHMMLVLEEPFAPGGAGARRVMTDNESLAGYLLRDFVARFPLFRPFTDWDAVELVAGVRFESVPGAADWTESARSADGSRFMSMSWTGLGAPIAVDLPPDSSATGEHEMFSVFRVASGASVTVDGRRLEGQTVERDFLGGRHQSAALALSETWVAG